MSAKHKGKGPQVMTANELREGLVVWLTADFEWSLNFSEALQTEDTDLIEKMSIVAEKDVDENLVVGTYFIDIDRETNLPARYRERFRVKGPSYDTAEEIKKKS